MTGRGTGDRGQGTGFCSARFLALTCFCAVAAAGQGGGFAAGKTAGRPDAPIRIEVFSDYQCPACKVLHEQTLRPVIADFVNSGKVYLVHREFPLAMHAHAREAAGLACAAEKMGKYRQVADQLFLTQAKWTADGNVAGPACIGLSAAEAKRLTELARSPEVIKMVEDDIRAAQNVKVDRTPTMIITRLVRQYPVSGPVSYPVLRRFLESLLN